MKKVLSLTIVLGSSMVSPIPGRGVAPLPDALPATADHLVSLEWAGPVPFFQALGDDDQAWRGYRPADAVLILQSEHYRLRLDGQQPALILTPRDGPGDELRITFRAAPPPSGLETNNIAQLPVRLIEHGSFFNHVTLEPIPLLQADGQTAAGHDARLEIRAWADRIVVEWNTPVDAGPDPLAWLDLPAFQSAFVVEEPTAGATHRLARLTLHFTGGEPVSAGPRPLPGLEVTSPAGSAHFNPRFDAWEIKIIGDRWPSPPQGAAYPPECLDAITRHPFSLHNPTREEIVIPLRFIHPRHPLTGFTTLLLDSEGAQTGWPLQISKNWHTARAGVPLAHTGPWAHGSTILRLPPGARADLQYAIVHARWQGLPAASVAQLSLVGWGGNGFWTQFALGSWGETLCIQPTRVLRRAYLTDIRPLFAPFHETESPLAWTSNVGGGDLGKIISPEGVYQPWGGGRTDYLLPGPNLARTRTTERLTDGSARLTTEVSLARDDELVRPIIRLRLEALAPLPFRSLDLVRIASEYYNSNVSDLLSVGTGDDLRGQWRLLDGGTMETLLAPTRPTLGRGDWILLHGRLPREKQREGDGLRALTLLDVAGRVGHHSIDHLRLVPSILSRPQTGIAFGLDLGAEVAALAPGDWVELSFQLSIFPSLRSYRGESFELREALAQNGGDWRLAAWEARRARHHVELLGDGRMLSQSPITFAASDLGSAGFRLQGTASWPVPILITDLPSTAAARALVEATPDGDRPLGQIHAEEADPQINYDPTTGRWTLVLSLRPAPSSIRTFRFVSP
jgi:hypothetical protein